MSATAASSNCAEMTDVELEALFRALDTDNVSMISVPVHTLFCIPPNILLLQHPICHLHCEQSNFIDANELKAFFQSRDIAVTDEEVRQMIEDADLMGREIYYEGPC
jgi:Ca2+-binding EF-hand superfamily protein